MTLPGATPLPIFFTRLRRFPWVAVAAAIGFLAFCWFVQSADGARDADFSAHGDEASHFVGSVMVRDFLVSGRWLEPQTFAREYYEHYPFFAIGYWPPAFYVVSALWLLVAGVGRTQALIVPLVFAAGSAWLIFHLVRVRLGAAAGICAGILYLSLPAVQQWMCAVMVDHFTAFFCLATGVCLLRYMKAPALAAGMLCVACCACAVLSKYSAVYLLALPFLAAWITRRRGLWTKPGLFLQPVLAAVIVAPWIFWTGRLIFRGLPDQKAALTPARLVSWVGPALQMFPPFLLAAVLLGLLALLLLPELWREDLIIVAALGIGSVAFLVISPVVIEQRYLLVLAASLLILSMAGWAGAWSSVTKGRRVPGLPLVAAPLAAAFAIFSLVARPHQAPQNLVRTMVRSVQQNRAWAGKSILVPSDLEGPFIAEFVLEDHRRPGYSLLRPTKVMASMNWFGGDYRSLFGSPAEAMDYFRKSQVDLIVSHQRPIASLSAHERILAGVLNEPDWWRPAASVSDSPGTWNVYERVLPQTGLSHDGSVRLSR